MSCCKVSLGGCGRGGGVCVDGSVAVVSCLQKMAKHIFKPIYNNRLYNKSNEVMRFFLRKAKIRRVLFL